VSGISVLLAPPPAGPSVDISLPEVQRILVLLKRMFSWVIVDLGLQLDKSALAFLESADRIVMSVVPEMVSLRNARLMLEALYRHGHTDEKIWLVINRATMAEGISVREIERQLHTSVRFRIPDDQPLATHSINRGVPMVMSHRRGAVIRAFRKLAHHLAEELPTKVEVPEAPFRVARRAIEETGAMGSLRSGSAGFALRPS
jgi:pilus assembly protein CpaE